MRFLLLAAFLALIASVCAEQNHVLVRRMNRDITQAINNFCGYTEDMVVPSLKATKGMASKNGLVVVKVRGDCNPKQWVPRNYCIDQFNRVAADSFRRGGNGSGTYTYGRNGCQKFVVSIAGNWHRPS